jgi:hypothetical protein
VVSNYSFHVIKFPHPIPQYTIWTSNGIEGVKTSSDAYDELYDRKVSEPLDISKTDIGKEVIKLCEDNNLFSA